MATTKLTDIINPQVMKDIIEARIEALCKLTPYAKVDTTLQGAEGDTVTVPFWAYVGDAEDFEADGDNEMQTAKLTASTTAFTIKCAGKSISILQKAINSGKGKVVAQANKQLAMAVKNKVDNDLMDACYTGSNAYNGTGQIGYNGIVGAVTKFDDEEDNIEKVMFINPKQEETLLTDSSFLSADKFTGGVAVNGAIGKIAGCWVKKSKKVKLVTYEKDNTTGTITIVADSVEETDTNKHLSTIMKNYVGKLVVGDKVKAATTNKWANPIVKLEPDSKETEYDEDELPALTIFLKEDCEVSHEHFPKKQRHDFTIAKYYGVALTNDAKVIIAKFNEVASV